MDPLETRFVALPDAVAVDHWRIHDTRTGQAMMAPHPNSMFVRELCVQLNIQSQIRAERRATREAEAAANTWGTVA